MSSADRSVDGNIGGLIDIVIQQAVLLQLVNGGMQNQVRLRQIVGFVEIIVPFLVIKILGGDRYVKQRPDGKQSHKQIGKHQRMGQQIGHRLALDHHPVGGVKEGGHDADASGGKSPLDGIGIDAAKQLAQREQEYGKRTAHRDHRQFPADIRHGSRPQKSEQHTESVPQRRQNGGKPHILNRIFSLKKGHGIKHKRKHRQDAQHR